MKNIRGIKMKSIFKSTKIILICLIVLLVSACSNGNSKDAANGTAKEEVTIKVLLGSWWEPNIEKIKEAYKVDHPNVTLEFELVPIAGYLEKAMASMIGGNAPDVLDLQPGYLSIMAERNMLMPWDDYIKDLKVDDFASAIWEGSQLNGKVYGIPNRATNTVLFYNKKMFDEANLSYPSEDWTYEDILSNAKKLTKGDQYGFGIAAASSDIPNVNMTFAPVVYGMEASFFNEDYSKFILNDPEGVKAITYFTELYSKEKVVPSGSLNYSISKDVLPLFSNNKVAMMPCSSLCLDVLEKTPNVDYDFVSLPGQTQGGGFTWSISSESEVQEQAREFVLWFTEAENMSNLHVLQPARLSATTSPPWNSEEYKKLMGYSKLAKPLPSHPKWQEANEIIVVELQKIMQGEKSPQEGADDMAKQINPLLKE
jgi:multiple sugar transport system substrate-binding protein